MLGKVFKSITIQKIWLSANEIVASAQDNILMGQIPRGRLLLKVVC